MAMLGGVGFGFWLTGKLGRAWHIRPYGKIRPSGILMIRPYGQKFGLPVILRFGLPDSA